MLSPGVYRHSSGRLYFVVAVCPHKENNDDIAVMYTSDNQTFWSRNEVDFNMTFLRKLQHPWVLPREITTNTLATKNGYPIRHFFTSGNENYWT